MPILRPVLPCCSMFKLMIVFLLLLGTTLSIGGQTLGQQNSPTSPLQVFDQATSTIEEKFYDPSRLDEAFDQLKSQLRNSLQESQQPEIDLAPAVNQLLASLDASHTYYLTPDQIEYYRIGGVFQKLPQIAKLFTEGKANYPSLGLLPIEIDGRWYIQNVIPKSQAFQAGLRIGDRLEQINQRPYHPIKALKDVNDNETVTLKLTRGTHPLVVNLPVHWIDPQAEFLQALKDSITLIQVDNKTIGYAHIYSYAGNEFHQALTEAISWGELKKADALVIDLRYGMGGASINYLNMFQKNLPKMKMIDRQGNVTSLDGQWNKPAVYLIDSTTRSGKETLAYGAKKLKFAKLVGTPTAGAVVAGSPFPMPNGDLLYLAVADVTVDGVHLEGNPVQPDVDVPLDVPTCDGVDLQKEAALNAAADMVK